MAAGAEHGAWRLPIRLELERPAQRFARQCMGILDALRAAFGLLRVLILDAARVLLVFDLNVAVRT